MRYVFMRGELFSDSLKSSLLHQDQVKRRKLGLVYVGSERLC